MSDWICLTPKCRTDWCPRVLGKSDSLSPMRVEVQMRPRTPAGLHTMSAPESSMWSSVCNLHQEDPAQFLHRISAGVNSTHGPELVASKCHNFHPERKTHHLRSAQTAQNIDPNCWQTIDTTMADDQCKQVVFLCFVLGLTGDWMMTLTDVKHFTSIRVCFWLPSDRCEIFHIHQGSLLVAQ